MPERTATPFLDERGPKTQLILLNRRASMPHVSLSPPLPLYSLSPLAGEVTPGTVAAETEACDGHRLLKTEG